MKLIKLRFYANKEDIIDEGKLPDLKDLKNIFNYYYETYFLEFKNLYPLPKFIIKPYEGRVGWYNIAENIIYIDPEVFKDETVLKRVVGHETIHFFDVMVNGEPSEQEYRNTNGHTEFFMRYLNRINQNEGFDLITLTQKI